MKRRDFCKKAVAGPASLAAGAGVVAGDGEGDDPNLDHGETRSFDGGIVSTRGHFSITAFNTVRRDPSVGQYEYEVAEPVPGFDFDTWSSPDELVVFVHGWLIDEEQARTNFGIVRDTLRAEGYESPLVGFSWDADWNVWSGDWYPSVEIARRNGDKLGEFVTDYRAANPDTPIRLMGHSLGAELALATVESLDDRFWDDEVDSITLLGAAVDPEEPSTFGRYEEGVRNSTKRTDNFHTYNDDTLKTGYRSVEFTDPLGIVGSMGETPTNYTDHAVHYVDDHLHYYREGVGCMDEILDTWESEDDAPGGGDGDGDGDGDGQTRTETGRLAGSSDDTTYSHEFRLDDPGTVTVELSGDDTLDADLYLTLDGRTPTTYDYDRRSWAYGSDQTIELDAFDLDGTREIGILIDAYSGAGEYTLTVAESGDDW